MEDINWRLSDKFRNHWIKVKFYKDKPRIDGIEIAKNGRFCEATKEALLEPILLTKENISCPGARYSFGWGDNLRNKLLKKCNSKRKKQKSITPSMLSGFSPLKSSIECIGLNTKGVPDMVLSYMTPEQVMELIKIYHDRSSKSLDVSLFPIMSICNGIAVRTYLKKEINISFGCSESRHYADVRRETLAVGIPRKLFKLFVN